MIDADALLCAACRRIADVMLPGSTISPRLGEIALRPEQRDAAARARETVARSGGVVIANDVGTGKTFIALAVAHGCRELAVVAPAVLADRWRDALRRAGAAGSLLGLERLSRTRPAGIAPDVVIVDESHHLRNPCTLRYDAVAALCRRARVILLSATPVQNRRDDLAAQLALFLGACAWAMSDDERARFVVRRRDAPSRPIPRLDGPHWVHLPDDDLLDALLALPPPLPPSDGGDGGALFAHGLVRRWASSRAALVASLRRRLAAALALEQALEEGRYPTGRELAAWSVGEGAMQLAFPELAVSTAAGAGAAHLLEAVRAQRAAVGALLESLRSTPDRDRARVDALRAIRSAHAGEIVLAFSEFAETVRALAPPLARDGGVVWLTGRGARTVAGPLSRRAALAQLAPGGERAVAAAERIGMLVTTDVSSEGLDLQRASVVVHLDLPWNPARLEQRVGRVRRLGATHERVTVFTFAPPAASEKLVAVERRLREKMRAASSSVGFDSRVLPPPWSSEVAGVGGAGERPPASAPELAGELERQLREWRSRCRTGGDAPAPLVAAAVAPFRGFVAALVERGVGVLLADVGAGISERPAELLHAVTAVRLAMDGGAAPVDSRGADDVLRKIAAWWESRCAAAAVGLATAWGAGAAHRSHATAAHRLDARDRAATRVGSLLARAPRHLRSKLAPLAEPARRALASPMPIGSERALAAMLGEQEPDPEAWLRAIAGLGGMGAQPAAGVPGNDDPPLAALILFVKQGD